MRIGKGIIIFAQVFGTLLAVFGLIAYGVYLEDIINQTNDVDQMYARAVYSAILALFVYFTWKSIWNAIVIIKAVSSMDFQTVCANKWIISSLSLTVGGLFTPYIISGMPNIQEGSTIPPKPFLSRAIGITMIIGAPIAMITYAAYMKDNLYINADVESISNSIFIVGGVLTALGVLAIGLFYQKNYQEKYNAEETTFNNVMMKIVANVITLIVTIELLVVMLFSVLRLIGSLYQLIEASSNRGGFFIIFYFLLEFIINFIYVGFVLYITGQTIAGIWKNDVEYNVFEPLTNAQRRGKEAMN